MIRNSQPLTKTKTPLTRTVPNSISGHFGTITVTTQTSMVCTFGETIPQFLPLEMFGTPGRTIGMLV